MEWGYETWESDGGMAPDSQVNVGFDLEQIATEMIFAGSDSLNSAS